jgi:hypothetical protein
MEACGIAIGAGLFGHPLQFPDIAFEVVVCRLLCFDDEQIFALADAVNDEIWPDCGFPARIVLMQRIMQPLGDVPSSMCEMS